MEKFFRSAIRRYYDVELPTADGQRKPWPLLLAMHGYEGDKDSMMRLARHVGAGKMVVISLQGPFQFLHRLKRDPKDWRVVFNWGTPYKLEDSIALHHRDLETMVRLAVAKYHADPQRVFLMAFSQACALNYRYVFTHPRAIRGVVAVCGGVPGDWKENIKYRPTATHVLHIAARQDEWYSREKNLQIRQQLAERAATLDFRFYDATHQFPRASLPHIRRWLEQHC